MDSGGSRARCRRLVVTDVSRNVNAGTKNGAVTAAEIQQTIVIAGGRQRTVDQHLLESSR